MQTFGQLKSAIRLRVFPTGEADNLVASHDKDFIDAIIDLQTWVPCLQMDNTDMFPQCSTTYNCGLTVLPCPRGAIKSLSIIDKLDPETGLEDATAADDYCSKITYPEVDFCHVRRYLDRSRQTGGCCGVGAWFGLPFVYDRPSSRLYPVPTDEDVPSGLPTLPMGFHYPQESTDRTYGRAGHGVWAKERGNIYVAPWIQSTETIIVVWDGIKRSWADADPVDDDPLFSKAVEEYVRWQHSKKWDRDAETIQDAYSEYGVTRQMLMRQCREETRVRNCEPSRARASSIGLATLYYNDEQAFTAECDSDKTGDPSTVIVPAGTVGSNISVADANGKALTQAQDEAEARLVCSDLPVTFRNTVAGSYVASCAVDGVLNTDAPPPTGEGVTIIIPVGTVSSLISEADANALAQAQAESDAVSHLACTYLNAAATATKACPDGSNEVTATVPAGQFSVTGPISSQPQQNADGQAQAEATNQAIALFDGTDCGSGSATTFWNTVQVSGLEVPCLVSGSIQSIVNVAITIPAHTVAGTTQAEANQTAIDMGLAQANAAANYYALNHQCGVYAITFPWHPPPHL